MGSKAPLVGRESELERLQRAMDRARGGSGSVLMLAGEAGVGKSRLAAEFVEGSEAWVLRGAPRNGASAPYAPLCAALRSHLRMAPDGLEVGALKPHLALLLPELGEPAPDRDRATIFEALRSALAHVAAQKGPTIVFLDDLQWSDEATLEAVAALATPLGEEQILIVAAHRSDAIPRDHMLRWLRNELRRGGELEEISLAPLTLEQTEAMLDALLPQPPSPALCRAIHDRTHGSPFFIEELVAALLTKGSVQDGQRGLELAAGDTGHIPETVRDAVLVGLAELSDEAREAAEAAAVAGESFAISPVAEISSRSGLQELTEHGQVVDRGDGRAAFRHSLAREAIYAEVPWLRRQALHRRLAESLEDSDGAPLEIASHWLAAGDDVRGREALLRAARDSEGLGAHRDAAKAARRALDLWPQDREEDGRVATLESYAACSERIGDLAEAAKAWRELASIREEREEGLQFAESQRRLAAVCELRGEREAGFLARRRAVDRFVAAGHPGDAAAESLAMANHRRVAARFGEATELAEAAVELSREANRADLEARALGLRGVAEAKGGAYERGLGTVRSGLALALERKMTPVAAELYQRLSLVLYDSADYRGAEEALDTALTMCQAGEDDETEVACVTCLVYVLRERGEWRRAEEVARELIEEGRAVWVAEGLAGSIHAFQGRLSSARRLLTSSLAVSTSVGHYNMFMDSTTALARVADGEGDAEEASRHCHELLSRWEQSDDHHYAVWGLRWAVSFFARRGEREGVHACSDALSKMAADGGHADALAALAQAIGEMALLDEDSETAAEQMARAVELHTGLGIPHERAQVELRAGVALAAAGERERAIDLLCESYRTARRLGAQPLAKEAAGEVAALGDSVAARLGRRSADEIASSPLTRRELEVLRHVSVGRTNREIAQELFLSHRTIDMHVRNILRKLDCRSRMEAVHRAGELELLG